MKRAAFLPFVAAAMFFSGCAPEPRFQYEDSPALQASLRAHRPAYPPAQFAVASDLHFYDKALGTEGDQFQTYLLNERKLLLESEEILDAFIREISGDPASFVLIPGDLTKDGEKHNHFRVAEKLARIKALGKKVYVINGNHDIQNYHAFRYSAAGGERIDSITDGEFADIYSDFGFGEALSRDKSSLSYVAEPVSGLWLVALDACLYRENKPEADNVTNGRFRPESLFWLEGNLLQAVNQKKAVIVMIHHGVWEHFAGQDGNFGEYLVDDWRAVSRLLAAYQARVVFSGHFHAQDIVLRRLESDPSAFFCDVETGSLITFPCPYRTITIQKGGRMEIVTRRIVSVPSRRKDFPAYAENATAGGLKNAALAAMEKYWVPKEDAEKLAPQIVAAFLAHYRGDERPAPGQAMLTESGLSLLGSIVVGNKRDLVVGLWNDLPPADNDLVIDLSTGE